MVTPLAPSEGACDVPSEGPAAAPRQRGRGSWLADFRLSARSLVVLDTGAILTLDRTLVTEASIWLVYHGVVRLRSCWMMLARRRAPRIWFAPVRPRPWYWVWSALAWAGVRIAQSPEAADVAFAFEDATWAMALPSLGLPMLNGACGDVSKTRVAEVFEAVFGYGLAVDPQVWRGPAVEKGEINGAHDGRVVTCPMPREPERHYQRLVDTGDGRFTYDLRTPCVGGRPIAVWIKKKPLADRFSIHNISVDMRTPEAVYSPEELALIERFLLVMGVDWAGLDILRDRASGLIYIVDVNKTDVGPIIALRWRDKIRSTVILAAALDDMLAARRRDRPAPLP